MQNDLTIMHRRCQIFTNLLAQQESLAILFVKFVINIVAVRSKKFAQFAQFVVEIT